MVRPSPGGTGTLPRSVISRSPAGSQLSYTEVKIEFVCAIASNLLQRQVGEKIARDLELTGLVAPMRRKP